MTDGPDDDERKLRLIVGVAIATSSIAGMFVWGLHFNVFGSDINFLAHPEQMGLPLFIVLGIFGAGFMAGGKSSGFQAAASAIVLLVVAFIAGLVRRLVG